MIRLIILLITVSIQVGISQKVDIPKKANTIYVDMSYTELGQLLVENEYEIASSNKDFGSIATEYKMIKKAFTVKYHVKIKATQKKDQMKLTMMFKTSQPDKDALNIEDKKLIYRGWDKKLFQIIVDMFEGESITCVRED